MEWMLLSLYFKGIASPFLTLNDNSFCMAINIVFLSSLTMA